jgi:hypothetical protein
MARCVGNLRAGHRADGARERRRIRAGRKPHEHLAREHAARPLGARRVLGIEHQLADLRVADRLRPQTRRAAGHGLGTVAGEIVQFILGDDINRGLSSAGANHMLLRAARGGGGQTTESRD